MDFKSIKGTLARIGALAMIGWSIFNYSKQDTHPAEAWESLANQHLNIQVNQNLVFILTDILDYKSRHKVKKVRNLLMTILQLFKILFSLQVKMLL